jgi:hypothetical protein
MGHLHQLLGVEETLLQTSQTVADETMKIFTSKHQLLKGDVKTLKMFAEGEEQEAIEKANSSNTAIATTVQQRLDFTSEYWIKWLDCIYQKEITNQTSAKADLVVDGEIIANDVPAIFLLGLENKLKNLKKLFLAAPTLRPGVNWKLDENAGKGVFINPNEDVKIKTQKSTLSMMTAEATPQHKAQVHIYTDDVPIGKITTKETCGHITPALKNKYLDRIDSLMMAANKQRQLANTSVASTEIIGQKLISYIMSE